ncbi:12713_t:CDS:2 [Funneliformis caledonium]|uniref:12713_t:CDS:1 n=1 Tax=Funneliformis caledonium TaxID=1117310 RepID=A0A9N9IWK3_9GLOM|nr:12713_t:CDS:2 [Funneliformis caledonium]
MSSTYAYHNNVQNNLSRSIKYYFRRYLGSKYSNIDPQPKPSHVRIVIWSFITSFVGIGTLGLFTWNIEFFREREIPVSISSMGATAILIYGTCDSPLAQPRNLCEFDQNINSFLIPPIFKSSVPFEINARNLLFLDLGHITSSLIGITVNIMMKQITANPIGYKWLTCALSVSLSMLVMQLTNTIHPPAGATALMLALDDPKITSLVYWWKQKVIDDQCPDFPVRSRNDDLEVGRHVTFTTPALSFNVRKENRERFHNNNNTSQSNSLSEITLANKSLDSSSRSKQVQQHELSLSEANEYISKLENDLNELRSLIQQLEL